MPGADIDAVRIRSSLAFFLTGISISWASLQSCPDCMSDDISQQLSAGRSVPKHCPNGKRDVEDSC